MGKALNDDELWEKCKKGLPITPEDLGLQNLTPEKTDNNTYWTEGIRYQ